MVYISIYIQPVFLILIAMLIFAVHQTESGATVKFVTPGGPNKALYATKFGYNLAPLPNKPVIHSSISRKSVNRGWKHRGPKRKKRRPAVYASRYKYYLPSTPRKKKPRRRPKRPYQKYRRPENDYYEQHIEDYDDYGDYEDEEDYDWRPNKWKGRGNGIGGGRGKWKGNRGSSSRWRPRWKARDGPGEDDSDISEEQQASYIRPKLTSTKLYSSSIPSPVTPYDSTPFNKDHSASNMFRKPWNVDTPWEHQRDYNRPVPQTENYRQFEHDVPTEYNKQQHNWPQQREKIQSSNRYKNNDHGYNRWRIGINQQDSFAERTTPKNSMKKKWPQDEFEHKETWEEFNVRNRPILKGIGAFLDSEDSKRIPAETKNKNNIWNGKKKKEKIVDNTNNEANFQVIYGSPNWKSKDNTDETLKDTIWGSYSHNINPYFTHLHQDSENNNRNNDNNKNKLSNNGEWKVINPEISTNTEPSKYYWSDNVAVKTNEWTPDDFYHDRKDKVVEADIGFGEGMEILREK